MVRGIYLTNATPNCNRSHRRFAVDACTWRTYSWHKFAVLTNQRHVTEPQESVSPWIVAVCKLGNNPRMPAITHFYWLCKQLQQRDNIARCNHDICLLLGSSCVLLYGAKRSALCKAFRAIVAESSYGISQVARKEALAKSLRQ